MTEEDVEFGAPFEDGSEPPVPPRPHVPNTPGLIPGLTLPRLPTWGRRVGIGLVMTLALALFAWGASSGSSGTERTDADPVVVAQFPAPDARALRQTEVGAVLRQGYDGRLTVNGVAIPEEQMEGAIDPASVSAEDLARYGIRPNNRNTVKFRPGEGKVLEALPPGELTVVLRYFPEQRPEEGRSISWTATVG